MLLDGRRLAAGDCSRTWGTRGPADFWELILRVVEPGALAVAIWPSGVIDCIAVAPGIPDLASQEKRDNSPAGLYRRLAQQGALTVADGLRVQPPAMLMDLAVARWGEPEFILCDRLPRQRSVWIGTKAHRIPIIPRVRPGGRKVPPIFGELGRSVKDGPLSSLPGRAGIVDGEPELFQRWQNDDSGNVRLVKRGARQFGA